MMAPIIKFCLLHQRRHIQTWPKSSPLANKLLSIWAGCISSYLTSWHLGFYCDKTGKIQIRTVDDIGADNFWALCMHIVYVAKSLSQSWSSKDWVNTQFKDWVNSQSWSHSWGWPVGQGSLHWNIIARMMIININININMNNNINIELPRFETSLLNSSILFPPAVYWDLATRPFTWNTIRCRLVLQLQ